MPHAILAPVDCARTTRPSATLTLDDLVPHYVRHAELRNTKRTLELNLSIIERFLGFARQATGLRRVPVSRITPILIEQFAHAREREGRTAWCINRERGALSIFFGCAIRMGLANENPVRSVLKLPVVRNRIPRTLKRDEISRLLAEAEQLVPFHGRGSRGRGKGRDRVTPLADMIRFVLNTGLRLGELLHLEWTDVDLERGTIHVANKPDHTIKSRQDRIVKMNAIVLGLLHRRRAAASSRWVFSGVLGQQLNRANALREFKRVCVRAGVPWAHWHALRKTFLTGCASSRMPPFVLREIAGHSSIRTTELYYVGAVLGSEWTPPEVGTPM